MEMKECKILFLAANPADTTQLSLDTEIREIQTKIRAAEFRDSLEMVSRWAVRPDDLLQSLNEVVPHVAHFSGHGTKSGIVLLDADGQVKQVGKEALAYLLKTLKGNLRLVVLNACDSLPQAKLIAEHIDCVVGMNKPIGDQAAIVFAASFYRAIGFGSSVRQAFEQGKAALMLEGIPEERTPVLVPRPGIDPDAIVLVQSQPPEDKTDKPSKSPQVINRINRSVYIGGNAIGNAIVTGDHNVTTVHFTKTTLPPPSSVDIQSELKLLSDLLQQLQSEDSRKIERAIKDAQEEAKKPEPDRDEVGSAVARALKYAKQANGFADTATKLAGHVTNLVAWLGSNWNTLLPLVGLKL